MEVATVGQSYAVGHTPGSGSRGVVLAKQQTTAKSFAVPVGDGQVAVRRVEVTEGVAVHQDEQGNVITRTVRTVGVTGIGAIRTSLRWSQEAAAEEEPFKPCVRWFGFSLMVLIAIAYTGMMIFGSVRYDACPNKSLANYAIVQGVFMALNATSLAVMFFRAKNLKLHKIIGILIYAFSIVFGTVHLLWFFSCKDSLLYNSALWYTIPIVAPFFLFIIVCCCSCFCRSK